MSIKLKASGVVKCFSQGDKTIKALNGVDLTINSGEFVAVMGASGSGKSTLMNAMSGLIDVDQGDIVVALQNLGKLNDNKLTHFRRQHIGLVFQSFNLIPLLTATENVALPALDAKGVDEKVKQLLETLGLAERANHKPDALSGGEQQRVAIARAMVTDPDIILLDEPTGSLDSVSGEQICQILRQLCDEQKRTIVVITHEPSVATFADRVVVLKDGEVVDNFATKEFSNVLELSRHYQAAVAKTTVEGE